MNDFFSNEIGNTIAWFGLTHILLMLGFIAVLVILWLLSPTIKNSKYEKWIRLFLIVLVFLFEWKVFESRLLNGSIFRMPLCALSLYGLTYSVAFKNEKVYKVVYFFAFGTFLTYLFFDTLWGLDRWNGWTFFGAHAMIGVLLIYGYHVLGFKPTIKDLYKSMIFLTGYALISGYAYYRFGGADELFLFHPPVDFVSGLSENYPVLYVILLSFVAIGLMFLMYLPIFISKSNHMRKIKQ